MRTHPTNSRAESHHQSHQLPPAEPDHGEAPLRAVEDALVRAGSTWNPAMRRWSCPAHRKGYSLWVRLLRWGHVHLECERGYGIRPGCDLGQVLDALGLSAFDLAPARFKAK